MFREIARVLKPGGRLAVSDIALKKPLPRRFAENVMAYVGCIARAILIDDYRSPLVAGRVRPCPGHRFGCRPECVRQSGKPVGLLLARPQPRASRLRRSAAARPGGETFDSRGAKFHERLTELLRRHNVNDSAASVSVFAIKPS